MKSTAPNLLLLWTDEQRPDTMRCYGNEIIRTPHLDRLAETSFVFDHAYCTQPVCTPSRASILTGLWPHTHRCTKNNTPLPKDYPTLAEMLSGYHSAYYGKWHLGDEIVAQRGFTEWKSFEDGAYRPFFSRPELLELRSDYHHYLSALGYPPLETAPDGAAVYSRDQAAMLPARHTKAGFLGREAAAFISRQPEDRPWFLSVNFLEPHMPFFGPLNDMYDPEEIPVGPAFARPPSPDMAEKKCRTAARYREKGFGGLPLVTEAHWRRMRANYYGLVSLVDDSIGRILDALDRSGQAENTIVVFTSDHGDMMGDHACLAKNLTYEQSVGIPLLIRAPGLGALPKRIPGYVSQIDLVPTLLELVGQPAPPHLQGRSLRPVLEGRETLSSNDVFIEWNNGDTWRTIISRDGWKLNLSPTDRCELLDLNTDPFELRNLFSDPGCRSRVRDLANRLQAWQKQTGDTVDLFSCLG